MSTDSPPQRVTLTRDAVVEAALAKADAEGIDAVTFRGLAGALGVTPMALYRYVTNKDELMTAIVERVFREFELPPSGSVSWQDELRAMARSYRAVLVAHPAVAMLDHAGMGGGSLNGLKLIDMLLGTLRRAGFSVEEAAALQERLERFVLALVLQETSAQTRTERETAERSVALRTRLLSVPPEQFSHVIEAVDHLCGPTDPDWAFALALDLMIGGLEKLLESGG